MQAMTQSIRARDNVNIAVRENEMVGSQLIVTGVWKGCADQDILEMMYLENPKIGETFGERFMADTRVITRRQCQNEDNGNIIMENIILETSLDIFRFFAKKGLLSLDMVTVFVRKEIHVVSYVWTRGQVLPEKRGLSTCSGPHKGTACKETV